MTADRSLQARSFAARFVLAASLATAIPGVHLVTPTGGTAAVDPALSSVTTPTASVIVSTTGDARSVERRLTRLGGVVSRDLPIIFGFAATVPADAFPAVSRLAGVATLSLDRAVHVMGSGDSSSLKSVYPKEVGATDMWKAGVTGHGVTVALIDTGIADVADLAGRVLPVYDDIRGTYSPCVNLSGEAGCGDSYGHGTFLAGIVAGNGASSGGAWKGIAPDANLVSVKIAGADGSADVSDVLAAIQWVVSFKDRYGIRVLNLSLGTDSTQTYRTDPLNYAVERAWAAGIVVVVSASNRGPSPGTISKPGDDPWVITVGTVDDRGTPGIGDDRLPNFSSRGPTAADGIAKPDVVAPGAHIVSLRAPGSVIDQQFPTFVDGAYRRGSGTSMAAAVVSGVAALMLEADPQVAPDRLKYALTSTAHSAASSDPMAAGAGVVDAYRAVYSAPAGVANAGLDRSSGLGSLDASRGTVTVEASDPLATLVSGTLTLQLMVWDPVAYTTTDWNGSTWYGSTWYGSTWYGSTWYGSTWYGSTWYGSTWYGQPEGSTWYGSTWYGSTWYGAWE
jgi:serine protease AprX